MRRGTFRGSYEAERYTGTQARKLAVVVWNEVAGHFGQLFRATVMLNR